MAIDDFFRPLSAEEYAALPPISEELIKEAIALGNRDAELVRPALYAACCKSPEGRYF